MTSPQPGTRFEVREPACVQPTRPHRRRRWRRSTPVRRRGTPASRIGVLAVRLASTGLERSQKSRRAPAGQRAARTTGRATRRPPSDDQPPFRPPRKSRGLRGRGEQRGLTSRVRRAASGYSDAELASECPNFHSVPPDSATRGRRRAFHHRPLTSDERPRWTSSSSIRNEPPERTHPAHANRGVEGRRRRARGWSRRGTGLRARQICYPSSKRRSASEIQPSPAGVKCSRRTDATL